MAFPTAAKPDDLNRHDMLIYTEECFTAMHMHRLRTGEGVEEIVHKEL
jgi:hypothetical protein